jgi:hypothetical protein
VPLSKGNPPGGNVTKFVDFKTGLELKNFTSPDPSAGLQTYGTQLANYPSIEQGFFIPSPIPHDLLLTFDQFVKKYNIQDAVPFIFNFAQGLGDLFSQRMLYVFKNFGSDILKDINTGFLTTPDRNNSALYEHATAELGDDVHLNSTIIAVDRSFHNMTKVLIKTPFGLKVIQARKLILAIPPKLDNLSPFDLDDTERDLFHQFRNSFYYTGVLKNLGIPDNVMLSNTGVHTQFNVPALPGIYDISLAGVPGLFNVKYGSPIALTSTQVQHDIMKTLELLHKTGIVNSTMAELVVFSDHSPFELTVPVSAIEEGFYKQLYGLQGHKNTFYTGATFHTHDSSLIWQFTNMTVLPALLNAL